MKKNEIEVTKESKLKSLDKKVKRRIIIGVIVVVIIGAIVTTSVISANTPMAVACIQVDNGDVAQNIETSGTIESGTTKVFFSAADVQLGEINVEEGDVVKEGDVLFTYDADDLALAVKSAQLKKQVSDGSYSDSVETNDKNQANYNLDEVSIVIIDQQIVDQQTKVDDLKQKIKDRKKELKTEEYRLKEQLNDDDISDTRRQTLTDSLNNNVLKQTEDVDLVKWNEELEKEEELLRQYKADKEEAKADKKATEKTLLTDGAKSSLAAKTELERITENDIINNLEAAKDGVTSEFNGIVTGVKGVEGSTLLKGAEILTVVSTDDLYVKVNLTKNDTQFVKEGQAVDVKISGESYKGTVSKINNLAKKNESGALIVEAEISIDEKTEDVIVFSEAKVSIHIAESSNVIVIPNDVINYNADGAFVMVVRDGIVETQQITLGAKSDIESEVASGLSAGDMIVSGDMMDIVSEGMEVTVYTE